MNYEKALKYGLKQQEIELDTNEIPFNIYLKNTGDILTLCFLEKETEDYLIIVETNMEGMEEVRIIPKENIEYISICYDLNIISEDKASDKMFR